MSTPDSFATGQRWISQMEPELGLGTVMEVDGGRVRVFFPAADATRLYAAAQAPLQRIVFQPGDTITAHDGTQRVVTAVHESDGSLTYESDGLLLPEAQLSETLSFQGPKERLFSGQVDGPALFDLRRRTLDDEHYRRSLDVLGFVGGRIDLIPHQLYIADEVSRRYAPRVLLSDDVGLGKTIEACLIVHRMLLTGRIQRVLVLVPDALVHQWFVEMYRRFNLWLHIYDEERAAALEGEQGTDNPFLDDQLILCPLSFLVDSPKRLAQARAAGWDLLVVDEAHHLTWEPEAPSPAYATVEALSQETDGLLLLTATPEQLGLASHFARLRLLDPERYPDFAAFQKAETDYASVADVAERLAEGRPLSNEDRVELQRLFADRPEHLRRRLDALDAGETSARQELLDDVLDLHGLGRVLFRNTRDVIRGFPERVLHRVPLPATADQRTAVHKRFAAEQEGRRHRVDLRDDPRMPWLVDLLRDLGSDKVLLICRTQQKALAIHKALRERIQLKAAVFHEDMTLVQRDRQAAWFAEPDGARLLICSEIGSEGRNFQFAHHLVLFDLPPNPEVLEQRIGRLDRIGQSADVQIYVPYLEGSPQVVLCRWFDEGLNAFTQSLHGANTLYQQFAERVLAAIETTKADGSTPDLEALVADTRAARTALVERMQQGRDRLLEMNAFRPFRAHKLVNAIRAEDQDRRLEHHMLAILEHYGIQADRHAPRTYRLDTTALTTDAFPALPDGGYTITFDRDRALAREDMGFLTWDHPLAVGAFDVVLGADVGSSSFAWWPDDGPGTLLLEAVFVLETLAAPKLHADRFLPPTPLRVVVHPSQGDVTAAYPPDLFAHHLHGGDGSVFLKNPLFTQDVLPAMIERAAEIAETQAAPRIARSEQAMARMLDHEISRLAYLNTAGSSVRPEERNRAADERAALAEALASARVRLDALRLIWKGSGAILDAGD